MSKPSFNRPTVVMLYGYPGSGKTYFGRQLAESLNAAHIQDDRLRNELFEHPHNDKHENEVVSNLMMYMAETFIGSGVSVIYDMNAMRVAQRRELREMAKRKNADSLLVWLQIDLESAFARVAKRDKRKSDDKYSEALDRTSFEKLTGQMQNPQALENYIVISGKHAFKTQLNMVLKRLFDMGIINLVRSDGSVTKPELTNRIPNPMAGRVDISRRNILIR